MTTVSAGVDDVTHVSDKTTTTVAMDFGRITLEGDLVMYLFGTPGQDRFGFMWDDLMVGAVGAVVLIDSRRFDDCFPAVDYFERRQIPFIAAVNRFDGVLQHRLDDVRSALDVRPDVPVIDTDARDREAVKQAILVLLNHALDRATGAPVPA
jgi:signal recognition particle receptor subunit beta